MSAQERPMPDEDLETPALEDPWKDAGPWDPLVISRIYGVLSPRPEEFYNLPSHPALPHAMTFDNPQELEARRFRQRIMLAQFTGIMMAGYHSMEQLPDMSSLTRHFGETRVLAAYDHAIDILVVIEQALPSLHLSSQQLFANRAEGEQNLATNIATGLLISGAFCYNLMVTTEAAVHALQALTMQEPSETTHE